MFLQSNGLYINTHPPTASLVPITFSFTSRSSFVAFGKVACFNSFLLLHNTTTELKLRKWLAKAHSTSLTSSSPSSSLLSGSSSSLAAMLSSGSVWFSPFLAIFLESSMLSMPSPSDFSFHL